MTEGGVEGQKAGWKVRRRGGRSEGGAGKARRGVGRAASLSFPQGPCCHSRQLLSGIQHFCMFLRLQRSRLQLPASAGMPEESRKGHPSLSPWERGRGEGPLRPREHAAPRLPVLRRATDSSITRIRGRHALPWIPAKNRGNDRRRGGRSEGGAGKARRGVGRAASLSFPQGSLLSFPTAFIGNPAFLYVPPSATIPTPASRFRGHARREAKRPPIRSLSPCGRGPG